MATVSPARAGGYGRRGPRRSVVSGLLAKRARRGRHTPTARLPQRRLYLFSCRILPSWSIVRSPSFSVFVSLNEQPSINASI